MRFERRLNGVLKGVLKVVLKGVRKSSGPSAVDFADDFFSREGTAEDIVDVFPHDLISVDDILEDFPDFFLLMTFQTTFKTIFCKFLTTF